MDLCSGELFRHDLYNTLHVEVVFRFPTLLKAFRIAPDLRCVLFSPLVVCPMAPLGPRGFYRSLPLLIPDMGER